MGKELKKASTSNSNKRRSKGMQPEYDFDYTKAKPNRFVGKIAKKRTDKSKLKLLGFQVALFGVLVLCTSPVLAQDFSSHIRDLPNEQAFQKLMRAKIFNIGGVGWGL